MVPKLPQAVIIMMARREARMHHYLWHQVRNMWLFYDEPTRQAIRNLGWEPPRPALRPAPGGRGAPIYDNNSGEDFLYMHRQMIAAVNAKLAEVGQPDYPKVVGWNPVPRPGDADFPVPPAWDSGDPGLNDYLKESKSDQFFNASFVPWEHDYMDPTNLRGMALGELGSRIEVTIHNRMHMRWCEDPGQRRPDMDPTNPDDIDPKWDDPSYKWLGDTYSSHVNSIFWKLHGWVDDRIEDWKRANNVQGPVQWKGTWLGKMPPHPAPSSLHAMLTMSQVPAESALARLHHDHSSEMRELVKVISRSGKFHHFYAKIND
jgi:hypothetical protein